MEKIQVGKDECPVATPPRVTVYTRVLHRACQILGGADQLAAHLRVSVLVIHKWLEGEDVPPSNIFLNASSSGPQVGSTRSTALRKMFDGGTSSPSSHL